LEFTAEEQQVLITVHSFTSYRASINRCMKWLIPH